MQRKVRETKRRRRQRAATAGLWRQRPRSHHPCDSCGPRLRLTESQQPLVTDSRDSRQPCAAARAASISDGL